MDTVTLLLVEHGYSLTQSLALAFERLEDIRVLGPVSDPDEALRTTGFDVVIVDLASHLALVASLSRRLPETPILGWNPTDDPGTAAAALAAGAVGLLPSVIEADLIVSAVTRALAGELVLPDLHLRSLVGRVTRGGHAEPDGLASLTPRELEVLMLISEGRSTPDIATRLGISNRTVQSHVKSVLAKLEVHSKVEAVRIAWRDGVVAVPA